jgi:hypothetical protein
MINMMVAGLLKRSGKYFGILTITYLSPILA